MQKPTISNIKQSGVLGEHFFSRDTLRFFGQTMSSFKTEWYDKDQGILRLYAPMRDHTGERMGTTVRYLKIKTTDKFCYQVACEVQL
jgi:hypothetical protein